MVGWFIWALGLLFEAAILVRALQKRMFSKYPLFYAYMGFMLSTSVLLLPAYAAGPRVYWRWYWPRDFVSIALGFGVILEILGNILTSYPGAWRVTKFAGLAVLGIFTSLMVSSTLHVPGWSAVVTYLRVARDMRTAEGVFLAGAAVLVAWNRIPLGRNLKGMVLGYGFYIGVDLIGLAIETYTGYPRTAAWMLSQPASYLICLIVWTVALWSYHPSPPHQQGICLQADCEYLLGRPKSVIQFLRTHRERMAKVARP